MDDRLVYYLFAFGLEMVGVLIEGELVESKESKNVDIEWKEKKGNAKNEEKERKEVDME